MTDPELPLPEFATLERVALPPGPKYRVWVRVEVTYDEPVEFETDGDPEEYLEDEENTDDLVEQARWGNDSDLDVRFHGEVEVSYDAGLHWQKWVAPEPARGW